MAVALHPHISNQQRTEDELSQINRLIRTPSNASNNYTNPNMTKQNLMTLQHKPLSSHLNRLYVYMIKTNCT